MTHDYRASLAHAAEQVIAIRPLVTLPPALTEQPTQPNIQANKKQAPVPRPGTALGYKVSLALAAGQALDAPSLIMLPIPAISTSQAGSLAKRTVTASNTQSVRRMPTMARIKTDNTTAAAQQTQIPEPQPQEKPTPYQGKPLPPPPPGWMKQHKRTIRDFDGASLDFLKLPQVRNIIHAAVSGSRTSERLTALSSPDASLLHDLHPHRNLSISDPKISGQPVQLRSRYFSLGPRGMSVGACQFVNLPYSDDANTPQLHLSTRPGPDSRPTFVLEYGMPLISEETGEVAYIFAATVDVTLFVREQVARLLATDEEYAEIAALGYAPRRRACTAENKQPKRKSIQIQQKHSGVFIDSSRNFSRRDLGGMGPAQGKAERTYASGPEVRIEATSHLGSEEEEDEEADPESPLDWLQLENFPVPPVAERLPALPANVETSSQQLFAHALTQYQDAFLLTSTATLRSSSSQKTQSGQWLISYTSSALHKRRKDLAVALSGNDEAVLRDLGENLAREEDVTVEIAWGCKAEKKMLTAVPMMRDGRVGGGVACWLCFLVDA